ncbi:MAG: hypothetical protein MMC23_008214 [Stictis urceolatum]|nr:hypothetical protein [Stictis urceolata]
MLRLFHRQACNLLFPHDLISLQEFFASYPGFEGVTLLTNPNRIMIVVTTTKLSQNIQVQRFSEHITEALATSWPTTNSWTSISWSTDAVTFIGRMSASMFVGPRLSRSKEWQDLTITYTQNMFQATRALRSWPAPLRPLVHWFLPECIKCRAERRRANGILQRELDAREEDRKQAEAEGKNLEKHQDTVQWMQDASKGRNFDPVDAQLAFAMAALHTTTELLKQSLMDIAQHPDLIAPLREEIGAAVAESGWTTAGVFKMHLLDSVIKETQRLKPGSLVNLERRALKDIVLPNGTTLPKGTHVAVDTSEMWSPERYDDPDVFDGYRALRRREKGGKEGSAVSLVASSADHFAFGMGKPVCPGRFFAAHEIKVALAKILLGWDVRLEEGWMPKMVEFGFEMLADMAPRVEVRRRLV